jgi:hypothetical protein
MKCAWKLINNRLEMRWSNNRQSDPAQITSRIDFPDADSITSPVRQTIPVLMPALITSAAQATAIEQTVEDAPPETWAGNVLTDPATFAITTAAAIAGRPTAS